MGCDIFDTAEDGWARGDGPEEMDLESPCTFSATAMDDDDLSFRRALFFTVVLDFSDP